MSPSVEPAIAEYEAAGHCTTAMVDTADPVTALSISPASPTGQSGWYLAPPSVTASATDTMPGWGVAAADVFVSVDGRPFVSFPSIGGPVAIPEGVHDVRAYSVDGAGRRSLLVTKELFVDESPAVATSRLVPPVAARNGWYRRPPTVVLRAADGDQNAGVRRIEFGLGGAAFQEYTGPVAIPAGVTTFRYRAIDEAGRVGPVTT